MIRGVKIELGGREFVLPALTLDQLEELEEDIATVSKLVTGEIESFGRERYKAMARVIHAALARNYPDMAIEEVRSLLDLSNVGRAWKAVMGVSGLDQKDAAREEQTAQMPTGGASAPASAPIPDGAGTKPAS
jgi:hypothetical protein